MGNDLHNFSRAPLFLRQAFSSLHASGTGPALAGQKMVEVDVRVRRFMVTANTKVVSGSELSVHEETT